MKLLPKPQKVEMKEGFLRTKKVNIQNFCTDERIKKALSCFETDEGGVKLTLNCSEGNGESYTLDIEEDAISIKGADAAGVFYAIQTLKQIFISEKVPCLHIEDKPDMKHRGFYHDVTRGKIPTVETLKKLIDTLAYYKMNSLQIYVEHTFPFKELGDNIEITGYITPEEIRELDSYCYENFIDFIPSIPTFGHLYELLKLEDYKKYQCIENFNDDVIYLWQRMRHHTIDPKNPESLEIIKSLIDQYMPLFRSDKFNICCDETFDLTNGKYKGEDTGKLYIDFVNKIVSYVKSKGKKVMMWGDILLKNPETIKELPSDIEFLNWHYDSNVGEERFETFENLGCTQIVCPGTSSWSRLVENIDVADSNIIKMLDLGYKHGAVGMLNTNWGDLGNPCSIELAMHGLVLGAAKSWNKETKADDDFDNTICAIEYKNDKAVEYIRTISNAHKKISWNKLAFCYSNQIHENKVDITYPPQEDVEEAVSISSGVLSKLSAEKWERDNYRCEILISAEGIIVLAELLAKLAGYKIARVSDTKEWLSKFRERWMLSNKESELYRLEKMFTTLENL